MQYSYFLRIYNDNGQTTVAKTIDADHMQAALDIAQNDADSYSWEVEESDAEVIAIKLEE